LSAQDRRKMPSTFTHVYDDCVESDDLHRMLRIIVDDVCGQYGVSNL